MSGQTGRGAAPDAPPPDREREPSSEPAFAAAARAVEWGWVSEEAVEAALTAEDEDPSSDRVGLVARLGLSAAQRAVLARARPLPPRVAAALLDPRTCVAERYVLLDPIGGGGSGEVVRAWDGLLDRFVALKLLRRVDDHRARGWFEREARLAASLALPSAAAVFDIGEHAGRPFIAMQLIEGDTLAALARSGPLDPERAARLVADAARAVDEAHRRGILHRDLKPANLMLDRAGRLFIMDFGIARLLDAARASSESSSEAGAESGADTLGETGLLVGTPEYMAPEQARSAAAASVRSDVYGLGATLFELVAGRPPFVAPDRADLLAQVLRDPAPSLADVAGRCERRSDRALAEVVARCLAKDPEARYPSAAALADALERWLEVGPAAATAAGRGAGGGAAHGEPGEPASRAPLAARVVDRATRGRWHLASPAAVALAIVVAVGVLAVGVVAVGVVVVGGVGGGGGGGAGGGGAGGGALAVASRPDVGARAAASSPAGPLDAAPRGLGRPRAEAPELVLRDPAVRGVFAVAASGSRVLAAVVDARGRPAIHEGWLDGGPRLSPRWEVPDHPMGLAIVGDALAWVDLNSEPPEGGSRVYRAPLAGGEPAILYAGRTGSAPIADAGGVATDGERLFVVDQVGGRVLALDLASGGPPAPLSGARYVGGFATEHHVSIAVLGDRVFVADAGLLGASEPEVLSLPAGGGAFASLHRGPPLARPVAIAASGDWVFVADAEAGNAVFVLPASGGAPTVLVAGPPFLGLTALAVVGEGLLVADSGDHRDARGSVVDGVGAIYRVTLAP